MWHGLRTANCFLFKNKVKQFLVKTFFSFQEITGRLHCFSSIIGTFHLNCIWFYSYISWLFCIPVHTGTVISKYSPIGINTLILTLTLWNIIAHRYAQHFIQLIRSYWKINKIIKLFILGLEVQGHRIWNYSSMSHCILHNRNMCFKRFN